MKIENNSYVKVQYKLHEVASNGTESLIEETSDDQPMDYIHGMGILLPDFEAKLEGLDDGDAFDFTLMPEQAYGPFVPELLMELDKAIFLDSEGQFDDSVVQIGRYLPMQTADGQMVNGLVLDITHDSVKMDFNHPLSGKTLHFAGHVEEARPATEEEQKRFDRMIHGGSCCCGDDGDCDCDHDHSGNCCHGEGHCH